MGNYENGAFTRQAIVIACKKLFYEKGYQETTYADICQEAHVNRSTLYYHFRDKEEMRYDVIWEYTIDCKHAAEGYCSQPEYHYILAMYLIWRQTKEDPRFRRFIHGLCVDYPVYTGKKDFSQYYYVLTDHMWHYFFDRTHISQLSLASVYGYIMCCMRMLCESPERYDVMELFRHCVNSSLSIWVGVPGLPERCWEDITACISRIPTLRVVKALA